MTTATPRPTLDQARRCAAPASQTPAPVVVTLGWSLITSGVTTWAVRLVNAMAERGRPVSLLVHGGVSPHADLDFAIHPEVEVISLGDLPRFDEDHSNLSAYISRYREVLGRLADRAGGPVVLSPNDYESMYAIGAAICLTDPDLVRIVGWQHTDTEYATQLQTCYEPMLQAIVGVSSHLCDALRSKLPHRAGDITEIPYGVSVPDAPARREPLRGRPLRLIYSGRMDHLQKRVTALVVLSDELNRRGIDHELLMIGDGSASALIDREAAQRPSIRRLAPVPPHRIDPLLDRADVFLLSSRYEGLSVSMLEAMARGCVPVVTGVRSGAPQVIEPGVNGELANVSVDAEDEEVAAALADAVERYLGGRPGEMGAAAWASVRDRYSIERHADAVGELFDRAAASPARSWPGSSPCVFTSASPRVAAVPVYAGARLKRMLEALAGRRIAFHAIGRHTIELAHVLSRSAAEIVGFTDDDPRQQGLRLWGWPIVAPDRAAELLGATDIIISSWMFQRSIWERRAVYERQGLTVHRIYADPTLVDPNAPMGP